MTTMTMSQASRGFTLRQVLQFDALTCVAFGLLLVFAAVPLARVLGLPQALLTYAGIALVPCAALMWLAARTLARSLVWTVILGNVAWIMGSVVVALMFEPTALGLAFIIVQAVIVDVLVFLEWRALRQR